MPASLESLREMISIGDRNQNTREDLNLLLSLRVYFYNALYLIFGKEPDENLKALLSDSQFEESARFVSLAYDSQALHQSALLMRDTLMATRLEDLQNEYQKTMLGPGKLGALPWESVYVEKARLIFQKSTLEVREFYRRFGYQTMAEYLVADDHLAIELSFMANVAGEFAERPEAQDLLLGQREFLKTHLLNWVPDYVHDLNVVDKPGFYQRAGNFLVAFLQVDQKMLEDI